MLVGVAVGVAVGVVSPVFGVVVGGAVGSIAGGVAAGVVAAVVAAAGGPIVHAALSTMTSPVAWTAALAGVAAGAAVRWRLRAGRRQQHPDRPG